MTNSKFSVVIPTMWKYKPFTGFLKDLVKFPLVDEIIIINNDNSVTPTDDILNHEKITMVDYGHNIYVNPAWNAGVKLSKNKKICIVNDDIIFDLRLFYKVDDVLSLNSGVLGLCPGSKDFNQPQFTDGSIDIVPWQGEIIFAYGSLMFVHKDSWIDIPEDLKVYYGDNWIFDSWIMRGCTPWLITNLLHYTSYATTTGSIGAPFLDSETLIYEQLKQKLLEKAHIYSYLKHEYVERSKMDTDINEHLPVLYEYASKCNHVTEFGVRWGDSTRAFLYANVTLRSYDLFEDSYVTHLFNCAKQLGKDVEYQTGDAGNTLLIDIQETDLLFIDTDHYYKQLSQELLRHGNKARKYLVFHDTISCAAELNHAILEFLAANHNWKVIMQRNNNNGLTILERI